MCNHKLLAESAGAIVLWCKECSVYRLQFNNIVMTLDERGFDSFKSHVKNCYDENIQSRKCKKQKGILFDTKLDGMHLCFSIEEIAALLSLMQEAGLSYYMMKYG